MHERGLPGTRKSKPLSPTRTRRSGRVALTGRTAKQSNPMSVSVECSGMFADRRRHGISRSILTRKLEERPPDSTLQGGGARGGCLQNKQIL